MSRIAAANARKLQRLADASDAQVAAAAGWKRSGYNLMINRALNGDGDMSLDQAKTIAERVYGLPLHVILIEDPKEFMSWLAEHAAGEVAIDLRDSDQVDDMGEHPSRCIAPLRLLDYIAGDLVTDKSLAGQGLTLATR